MGTIRFQVDIDEEQMAELEELRAIGGLRTKKDLLNNALTLLKWAAGKRAQGWTIVSVNDAGVHRELEMPFLDAVAARTGGAQSRPVEAHPRKVRRSMRRIEPARAER